MSLSAEEVKVELTDPFSTKHKDWELHEGVKGKGKASFELGNVDAFDTDKITGIVGGAIERNFSKSPVPIKSFNTSVRIFVPKKTVLHASGSICLYGKNRLYFMALLHGNKLSLRIDGEGQKKSVELPSSNRDVWYVIKVEQAKDKLMAKMWDEDTKEPEWQLTIPQTKGYYSGIGLRAHGQEVEFDDLYFNSKNEISEAIDFTIRNSKPQPKLQMLPAGDIMPNGWIKKQMETDLTSGFYGNFDTFASMVTHDLFGSGEKRFSGKRYEERVAKGTRGGKCWWSGEHEGFWKDGMVRMAFLTGNKAAIAKAHAWVKSIVEHAAKDDGYIGIYAKGKEPGARFNHPRYNGELWTQSRIMMMLLAYYEFTKDKKVLNAVENAVALTMKQDVDYFKMVTGGGGIPHGAGFFEVLKELYCLTGEKRYINHTMTLFKQYNSNTIRFPGDDLQIANLADPNKKLNDHTPHIAESGFVPYFASMITESAVQRKAAANLLDKLAYHTNPSGSVVGDECVGERPGSADMLYEHCAQMAMMAAYSNLMGLSGNVQLADRIEKIMFNAIEGAWMPDQKGVVYCAIDNVKEHNINAHGGRMKYSSCHNAACCVLCAGRSLPYYVQSMWMKDDSGVIALSYGPSTLTTKVAGQSVTIKELTNYPFSNEITFEVSPETSMKFSITLRKPFGCKLNLSGVDGAVVKDDGDVIRITKEWMRGDSFKVTFEFEVKKVPVAESETVAGGGYYLQYGPLVFAKPFNHKSTLLEDFGGGFGHFKSENIEPEGWDYTIDPKANFTVIQVTDNEQNPWVTSPLVLEGELIDENGKKIKQCLVPMGTTTFRRVAFPAKK